MTTTHDAPTRTIESVREDLLDVQRKLGFLASLDLGFLSDEDVDALLPEVEEAARVLPVVQQALTAQVIDRGLAETYGCTSPTAYLQAKLRSRRSEANARVGAAERFSPGRRRPARSSSRGCRRWRRRCARVRSRWTMRP